MKHILALSCVVMAWAVGAAYQQVPVPLKTEWGAAVTPENAWRQYPRPQLVRGDWTCLNGLWQYAVTGNARDTRERPSKWDGEILVPFAIESSLSGVGRLLKPDELLWYRRTIPGDVKPGERLILHFEGVDFRTQVFVGHREVGDVPHEGGLSPFAYDITDFVQPGENELTVCVWDPTNDHYGANGKQMLNPGGIFYTRTSGIWQSVWLERVPAAHITGYYTACDLAAGTLTVTVQGVDTPASHRAGQTGTVRLRDGEKVVATGAFVFGEPVTLKVDGEAKTWSPERPFLYDLDFTYGADAAKGYCALRTFERRKDVNGTWRFFLNGQAYFAHGPLDQGWWPDGLLTPPSEEAMRFDIQTIKDLGCNMMRKHIKQEPARYYRLCDEIGLLVFQDMPTGTGDKTLNQRLPRYGLFRKEFKEFVDSLRVFPSIVMWMPYNEGGGQPGGFLTHCTHDWVRAYDPTRLVGGPSGWHDYDPVADMARPDQCVSADTIDMHSYRGPDMPALNNRRISFLGEFGGLGQFVDGHVWYNDKKKNWGYGGIDDTATKEGLENVYLGLMKKLERHAIRGLSGSVYTQTTDVEQELNGYLTYDRKVLKMDAAKLRAAHAAVYRAAQFGATRPIAYRPLSAIKDGGWAYTEETPPDGWTAPDFDDKAWARGAAGFCSKATRHNVHATMGTEWKGQQLFLRKTFTYTKDAAETVHALYLNLFFDENVTVWLNGHEIYRNKGFNALYNAYPASDDALAHLREGENVLAVSVKQTMFDQYFDGQVLLQTTR